MRCGVKSTDKPCNAITIPAIFAMGVLWLLEPQANADVYEVGTNKTYKTLPEAFDALVADVGGSPFTEEHSIRVYDGLYTAGLTFSTELQPTSQFRLFVQRAPGHHPILDGAGFTLHNGSSNITIDGFEIRNPGGNGVLIKEQSLAHVIRGCHIHHCLRAVRAEGRGRDFPWPGDVTVHDNVMASNTSTTVSMLDITSGTFARFYNNVIHDNAGAAFEFQGRGTSTTLYNNICYNNSGGLAYVFTSSGPLNAYNNTFYNNGSFEFSILTGRTVSMFNNIVWAVGSSHAGIVKVATTQLTSNVNDLYATKAANVGSWNGVATPTLADWQAAGLQDAQSLSADPEFVKPGADFHLWFSSPCRDRGVTLTGVVDFDFENDSRPKFAGYDIGADEAEIRRIPPPTTGLILEAR